ncbi:MAG: V-type ATP synthase subunit I [Candidatus Omnitrophota bacterium]
MAIAKIKKIQILGHKKEQEAVLGHLQDSGAVEITRINEALLPAQSTPEESSDLENELRALQEGIDTLSLYEPKKAGLLGSLFKAHPIINPQALQDAARTGSYQNILTEIKENETNIKQLESRIRKTDSDFGLLIPWSGINITVHDLFPARFTHVFLGEISNNDYIKFSDEIEGRRLALFLNTVNKVKKKRYLAIISLLENEEEVRDLLQRYNFNFFHLPESLKREEFVRLTIKQCLDSLKQELGSLRAQAHRAKDKMEKLLPQRILLMGLYDYNFNFRNRLLAVRNLGSTQQAFLLEGWVRAEDLPGLEARIKDSSSLAIFSRPALPSEDVPVDLENKPYFEPFEVITSLYGMPARYSIDPTPFLAPFFFIAFGLCLTDAGYGLIITVAALIILRKLKLTGPARKIINLFLLCGISTIILGSLIGGWFGVPVKQLMLFDPMKNPLIFLMISLAIGFIQVEFGLLIKMAHDLKQKQLIDAFLVRLAWVLLLPSLVLTFTKLNWAKSVAVLTTVSIVLFSSHRTKNIFARIAAGLCSLYDISRHFADVVSYSRLLALGLSTSVIAMVVNILSLQALNIPLFGGIAMVLVLVFGHLFNLAINTLSAFVHSARLQFVEFFGKFFISGGRPLRPFKKERIYT